MAAAHIFKPPTSTSFRLSLAMTLSDSIPWTKSERLCQHAITFLFLQTHKLGDSIPHAWNTATMYFERFSLLSLRPEPHNYILHKTKVFCPNTIYLLLKAKITCVADWDAYQIPLSSPTINHYSFVTLEKA